jgi:tetratricopeptide (TPR) repeat protein
VTAPATAGWPGGDTPGSPGPRLHVDGSEDLAALEEQRDFLLRSLEDLERERAAGDVDDEDYATLEDDYTARAAAVIRAIEQRRAQPAGQPDGPTGQPSAGYPAGSTAGSAGGRRLARTAAWAVGVLVFAVLAGVLVAQASGRRDPGGVATGDIRQTVATRLNQALTLMAEGDHDEAIERFDVVLASQPTNAEALTYRAWALRLSGEREEGFTALLDAATVAPDYPDAHALLAVVFFQEGLPELAARELEILEGLDPPAHVRELVGPLADRIDEALADRENRAGDGGQPDGRPGSQAGGGR